MQKTFLKNNLSKILLLLIYAIFTFVFLIHHEIWADEAQAWLIARDMNPLDMFFHLQSEGHPIFWYLILMPFAKIFQFSNSIFYMQIINWILIIAGAGVLVFKSPFSMWLKTAVLASSGFLYWYSVNARNYCLIPILLFSVAIFYPKRKEHPFAYSGLIMLLANTHVIMFGVCFALGLMFLFESLKNMNKKNIFAGCLVFFVLAGLVIYFWDAQNSNYIVQNSYPHSYGIVGFLDIYKKVVLNIFGFINFWNITLFTLFLLFCCYVFWIKDKKILFVFVTNFVFQFGIYMFVWMVHPPRVYLILLVSLFCFWCIYSSFDEKRLKNFSLIFLSVVFLLTVFDGFKLAMLDYLYDFSGGVKAAEYLRENVSKDAFIVSNFPLSTTAVSAYLPRDGWKIYYDGYKNFYTYTIWDKKIAHPSMPVPLADLLKEHDTVYVILSTGAFYTDVAPIYESDKNVLRDQEKFRIYKFEREN